MHASRTLFYVAAGYWFAVEIFRFAREELASWRPDTTLDRGSRYFLVAFLGGGLVLGGRLSTLHGFGLPGSTESHFLAGGIVVLAGTSLRLWSMLVLGRWFRSTVTIQTGQTVITAGPYRLIRHPSYTALLINACGLGIALGSWLSLLVSIPLVFIGLYIRIRVEEDALSHRLGAPYQEYMRRSHRLIPFLY